ncbi:MAG: hypothetical protein DMD91_21900 [Candidatus Rokuibacteriota bacterium]|nr:MAG: hypothetical protein DMD91_21900 [Candidatus Rokubacteria bacterium]
MRHDVHGLHVTTESSAALETYDAATVGLLGWDASALDWFRAAADLDPQLALAHAGAAVGLFLEERFDEAAKAAASARAVVAGQGERERSHVEAMSLLVTGKPREAEAVMSAHLLTWPRDLLIAQRLYFIWFWQGRFREMLDLTTVIVRHSPGNSFALGLHAFALEENGRCDEAVRVSTAALARNPADAWAVHALAHALYEMATFDTGIARLPGRIHPCQHVNWFRDHLVWHLTLMHYARGDYERASTMARSVFERRPSAIAGELHDSISLLWRLMLVGQDVNARWEPFAEIARGRINRPVLLFHSVHLGMALSAAGDWASAGRHLDTLRERASRESLLRDVVVPLTEGMQAFAGGDYRRAVDLIEPLRLRLIEIGGSRAQRDVFHDTLLEACFRAGDAERAQHLLTERVKRRPDHCWTSRQRVT